MKTWIEVSRRALQSNYRVLSQLVRPAQVLAVLKSDAYGHGLLVVAEALKDVATGFAVDRVEEGRALRAAGMTQPILVLGYTEPALLYEAIEHRLELTIASFEQLQQLHFTTQEGKSPITIHLEGETGLYRQGIPLDEVESVAKLLVESPWIQVKGCYTHFANVEEDETGAYPRQQLERFSEIETKLHVVGIRPPFRHTACSAAAIVLPPSRFEAVRAGIALYGLWSSELTKRQAERTGLALDVLQPALVWKTMIAQVKEVRAGETIGYARSKCLTRDTRVAILPIGYYDGYTRLLSGKGIVGVNGARCPILGRICMNMCMVDVTDAPGVVQTGTEVTLIGPEISAEELYTLAGTIHHDLLACISSTIPRRLVD